MIFNIDPQIISEWNKFLLEYIFSEILAIGLEKEFGYTQPKLQNSSSNSNKSWLIYLKWPVYPLFKSQKINIDLGNQLIQLFLNRILKRKVFLTTNNEITFLTEIKFIEQNTPQIIYDLAKND